eukprot:m.53054 g.53054  ORF g.53054 m.53054 type:complete len:519 (+) comp12348_c0_seq3:2522-4078(+)
MSVCPHVVRRRSLSKGLRMVCEVGGCEQTDPTKLFLCLTCDAVLCATRPSSHDDAEPDASQPPQLPHLAEHIEHNPGHPLYLQCLDIHIYCVPCQAFVYPREIAGCSNHEDALEHVVADWLQVLGNARGWWHDPEVAAKPGCYGLKNFGNTCFFTSMVQCLLHCKPLLDALKDTPLDDRPAVHQQLVRLAGRYWSDDERDPFVPRRLWKAVAESGLFGVYLDDHMEDTFTLLVDILDALEDKACGSVFDIPMTKVVRCRACGKSPKAAEGEGAGGGSASDKYLSLPVCPDGLDDTQSSAHPPKGEDGEEGTAAGKQQGDVDVVVATDLLPLMCVEQAAGSHAAPLELGAALEQLSKPEVLPEYKCDTCDKVGECTTSSAPREFPPVVVVHLQRFVSLGGGRTVKHHRRVKVPQELTLRDALGQPAAFALRSFVVHDGGTGGGHYMAYVNTANGEGEGYGEVEVEGQGEAAGAVADKDQTTSSPRASFTWFSDEFFGPVSRACVDASEPFVLFYERIAT